MSLFVYGGIVLACMGLGGALLHQNHLRKIIALNLFTSGIFLFFIASNPNDPVVQAIVLTGIVVALAATALGLGLVRAVKDYP